MSYIGHRSSVNLAEALRKPVSLVSDLKTTASEEDDRRRQAQACEARQRQREENFFIKTGFDAIREWPQSAGHGRCNAHGLHLRRTRVADRNL